MLTHAEINKRHLGMKGGDFYVIHDDFMPTLQALLDEEERLHRREDFEMENEQGQIARIARHLSQILTFSTPENPVTAESAARKLWNIRNAEPRRCSGRWWDALMIALGTHMNEHPVPMFPSGHESARQAAEAWAEDWMPSQQIRLAQSLHNFARGYFAAAEIWDAIEVETEAEQLELVAA